MMIRRSRGFIFGCSLALAAVIGCGSGTRDPGPVERGIPGVGLMGSAGAAGAPNGVVPTAKSQFFVMPVDPGNGSGLPPSINDLGPRKVIDQAQCDADAAYDFAIVDNYEGGKASHTYSFNDSTSEVLPLVNKDWEPPATAYPAAWTARLGKNLCGPGSATSNLVLHLAGHFTDFGAGLGTVLFFHTDTLGTAMFTVLASALATRPTTVKRLMRMFSFNFARMSFFSRKEFWIEVFLKNPPLSKEGLC